MENPSFYSVFERMWQHILTKLNSFVSNEVFNDHIENKDNPHEVTKEHVGLGDVDNTADIDKPISNAMQAALDDKADSDHAHDAADITSGILDVEHGGTGYNSVIDDVYTTPRYRASALVSTETDPVDNGIINWMYE
jgi:hypothetical protein